MSSLLSIFYLFYNANLLKNSVVKKIKAEEFIDDITFIATDKSTRDNTQKLVKIYN